MQHTFYTVRQVADRLGVRWYRIKYSHQAGHVPEPLRVGGSRLYTEEDIRLLRAYFGKGDDDQEHSTERQDLPGLAEPKGLCLRDDQREREGSGLPAPPARLGA